jgi:protein gp37
MSKTRIDWTDSVWNPVVGCSKLSSGCDNCYAEKMHKRLQAMGLEKYSEPFNVVRLHEYSLNIPSKTKKPTVFFVNSMSDLFHKDLNHLDTQRIFYVMKENPKHIFLILTKRPEVAEYYDKYVIRHVDSNDWTENIWLGVTIESAKYLHRAETLQKIPARHKFISFEPLLDRIELTLENLEGIDWVIVGGESGQKARPLSRKGAIDIFLRSQSIGVPFFFKQQGSNKYPPAQLNDYYNGKLISEYKQFPYEIQKLMEGKKKK